jgi:TP901 family phage tail tape measure protein
MANDININIGSDVQGALKGLGKLNLKLINFSQAIQLANQAAELASRAYAGLERTLGSVIQEGREFEKQMSAIRAVVGGMTNKEFRDLERTARQIGKTTSFSAKQAAEGMTALAKAGLSTSKIINTTGDVLNLAAASTMELGDAADMVAVSLNIFKEQGLQAQEAVDLMVQTINASPQSIFNLREALKNSQSTVEAYGLSFEELTVILGAMADAGVRGERAGTALNGAMSRLGSPTAEVKKQLKDLGIVVEQLNPLTNSFGDILDKVQASGADVNQVIKILGLESGPKMIKLFQGGSKTLEEFARKQKDANSALETARIMMDNLDGDIKRFNSAVSEAKLTAFDVFANDMRDSTQFLTELVNKIPTLVVGIKKFSLQASSAVRSVTATFLEFEANVEENTLKVTNVIASFLTAVWVGLKRTVNQASLVMVQGIQRIVNIVSGSKGARFLSKFFDVKPLVALNSALAEQEQALKRVIAAQGKQMVISGDLTEEQKKQLERTIELAKEQRAIADAKSLEVKALRTAVQLEKEVVKKKKEAAELAKQAAKETTKTATQSVSSKSQPFDLSIFISDALYFWDRLADKFKTGLKDGFKDAFSGVSTAWEGFKSDFKRQLPQAPSKKDNIGVGGSVAQGAMKIASQVTGVSGAISGFQSGGAAGAAIGFATDILLANEKFANALNRISEILIELLDPVIDALMPLFEELIVILQELKPIFKAIGRALAFIMPIVVRLIRTIVILIKVLVALAIIIFMLPILFKLLPYILAAVLIKAIWDLTKNFRQMLMDVTTQLLDSLGKALMNIGKAIIDGIIKILTFGGSSGPLGGILPFHDGGTITSDRMIPFAGAKAGEGLIVAQRGETVIARDGNAEGVTGSGGNVFNFYIKSLNPREQQDEIVTIIEENILTGRLAI